MQVNEVKQVNTKDVIICGMALFAIFFGAGNLIFPPYLGILSGDRWFTAMFGFLLSDPFLPVLGVIATARLGGRADDLGKRVSPGFAKLIGTLAILIIGPILAVPRTSATTHEIFIQPMFPNIPIYVTSIVFFALTLFIILNPGKVMDIIGQYLTPVLLLVLAAIIIKSIIAPPGAFIKTDTPDMFRRSFLEGYQTMDALGASLMSGIVLSDLIRRGYKDPNLQLKANVQIGIVAFILLALVYGGLTFAGATVSEFFTPENTRVEILLGMTGKLLGKPGQTLIGLAVALACLTTSTGLLSTCGDFFDRISNGKLAYKKVVIVATIVSFAFSIKGVEGIINMAVPILLAIFPVVIALIIFSMFDTVIKYDMTYIGAVIGALFISIPQAINALVASFGGSALQGVVDWGKTLPLAAIGFEWLLPSIISAVIFTLIASLGHVGKTREDHMKEEQN